ncbi:hypothetical protein T4B_9267 [Trichinella pseudospiralis]|uniref:Uncharacterized protein n=1 Tax=Trichinella pseudospiralis TaxID=6337 RepID=A0A0V1GQR4_TRIPS|nr:hypothetical protein T4B_9267 [Trichinella pseudospiralis]
MALWKYCGSDVTNKKKKIFLTGTTRNRAQAYEVEETKIGGACGYLSYFNYFVNYFIMIQTK